MAGEYYGFESAEAIVEGEALGESGAVVGVTRQMEARVTSRGGTVARVVARLTSGGKEECVPGWGATCHMPLILIVLLAP